MISKEEKRAYDKAWYKANKERLNIQERAYYAATYLGRDGL